MRKSLRTPNKRGQTLIEYALLLLLLGSFIWGILILAGVELSNVFQRVVCRIRGTGACQSYFVDEFDSLDDDWTMVRGRWDPDGQGQLCAGPGEGRVFAHVSADDYIVRLEGVTLTRGKGYGLYFRATNPEKVNGYNFQVDPGYRRGSFLFRKWVRGKELRPFARTRAPAYDWYNQPHDIRIEVEGESFTAYVDGEQVLQASDSTYNQGGVGLRTWDGTQVCFDRISVDPLQ